MKTPYIIAEIGSNCFKWDSADHNLQCAMTQIEKAKTANADAVKFQFFTAAELWGPGCEEETFAKVQNLYSMPVEWLPQLAKKCAKINIDFLCTAFSPNGYKVVHPYVKMHKVASPEMTAPDIAVHLHNVKKRRIFSLGCTQGIGPWSGMYELRSSDIVLECVSEYPADPTHYDIYKVNHLSKRYGCRWGISDHTKDHWLAVYSRSLGASVFEKHVDFVNEFGRTTPDSDVSVSGECFKRYVASIRSQRVIDHDSLKTGPILRLSRARRAGGWYRKHPEGE